MRKKLHYLNYQILVPYLILLVFGCVMVYSASSDILLLNGLKASAYGIKQAEFDVFAVGVACFVFASKLSNFQNRKFVFPFLYLCFAMLILLVFKRIFKGNAAAINGAVGWIDLGPINIQPLEFAKLGLVLYLAFLLERRDGKIAPGTIFESLINPAIVSVFMMALVVVEPDIGGTAILFMITLVMFATCGVPTKIAVWWILGVLLAVLGIFFLLVKWNPSFLQKSYQYQRIMSFLHPFELEKKGGAQLVNSYYAIHNGGLFGVGLGNSVQKRGYLPEPYTDFILSIIAEELGIVGACIVVGLLFYLIWSIMEVGVHAISQFNSLVCFGVATIILMECIFNIGAVIGLLPITGVTLPFISYGGSSVVVLSAGIGLVLNISANERKKQEEAASVL